MTKWGHPARVDEDTVILRESMKITVILRELMKITVILRAG
ncbi:MAG: hypothetical protein ACRCUZ_17705 [Shewanella sp.]